MDVGRAAAWFDDRAASHLLGLGLVLLAVTIAYANSFGGGFVLDSRALVLDNPGIRQATLANVRTLLTSDYWQPIRTDGLYRPLTTLSFLVNYAVLGNATRPLGYHVLNLLLHLTCTALVYALLWQLVRRRWPALVAAALFGLHPIATEAVTNIAGRADLLATVGVLGGLVCHIRASTSTGWRCVAWSGGLVAAAAVAFFSKESGLVLVAVTIAWDVVLHRPAGGERLLRREHLVTAVVLAAYLGARVYVARSGLPVEDTPPLDNPIVEAGFWMGRLTAVGVVGRGLALLLWPATLSADYSYAAIPIVAWPPATWSDWQAIVALAVLAALAWAAVRIRRDQPALFFLVLFYGVALLPAANLVAIVGSILGERFLYLPLAGFAGAVALAVERAAATSPERRLLATGVVGLALVACGWRTWQRNTDWTDDLRLWTSAVGVVPGSAKAQSAYAAALFAADPGSADLDRVIAAAERAVAIRPDYLDALVDLGGYYVVAGDRAAAGPDARAARDWYAKSVAVLERGRELDAALGRRFVERMVAHGHAPDSIPDTGAARLYNNLSLAYVRAERYPEALAAYEQSRRLEPGNPRHYVDMSAVLCTLGRWEEASVALLQALTMDPTNRDAALRLPEVYRVFYPNGHAVLAAEGGRVELNADDPVVHRHRCHAYRQLASIYARAKLPGPASRVGALAVEHCRPEDGPSASG